MKYNTTVQATLSYIEANLDGDLSLKAIAEKTGYSPSYVNRIFAAETGSTVHQYLRGLRLRRAAKALAESEEPIVYIALAAGYGSQQAFTQAFSGWCGTTPRVYRNKARLMHTGKKAQLRIVLGGNAAIMGGKAA